MLDYQIFTNANPDKLAKEILRRIKDGWHLEGGVSVTSFPNGEALFAQAMTKNVIPR